jgi:hypothetical protein
VIDLVLVPRPRHIEERSGHARLDAAIEEHQDTSLPAQGFELTIDDDGVRILHADDAGLRYGRALFQQIHSQSTDTLPGLVVRDHPDFPVRAYMLDISRDRVPTRETLLRILEVLTLARINQFQLYTEHTFAYRDHEVVWRDASPMTPDDVRWLDDECRARGIELAANQNCFGHMNRWLVHDAYRRRAEKPEGGRAPWGAELPPWTLAPTQDNADFVLHLFDELLPNFTSKRVNIGCDEPFDLGQGVSADEIAKRGKTEVYLEHLDRIARPLVEQGYEVLVWGDILREDPALAAKILPDGVVALPWHYEQKWPDDLLSQVPEQARQALEQLDVNPAAGFRPHVEPLTGIQIPFWVAPGTSTWNSLIGRIDNALGNLLDAAEQGLAAGARGYLITDWGDNGHHQPPSVSWGPLLYGGAVSWCLEANRSLDVDAALDTFVFEGDIGRTLHDLGLLWRSCGQLAFNGSPIFRGLVPRTTMSFGEIVAAKCSDTIGVLDDAMSHLSSVSLERPDGDTVKRELTAAARLARHGVWRMLRHIDAESPSNDVLRTDLTEAIDLQRDAWLERSRPGGLRDSLARLERTLAEYD